ncbi:MAG: helix-turn-helix domain-containing protein [Gammaproteobacteria bacterium]|nr:MAG: helix-turn-helix domain-containing protein [Gammaproteobacteria bacterium]
MKNDYWFQPPSDFLGCLSSADRQALLSLGKVQNFRRGEYIFSSGAKGNNVYILEEGRTKIYKLSSKGKEVILWFCFPGEIFGLAEVTRAGSREVFSEACTNARVYSISRENFTSFLAEHPDSALQTIDLLSCRMRVLGDMLMNLVTDDVPSRLIKLLTRLASRYGRREGDTIYLDIHLTHQDMADMIGASRQTVTSELNNLKRKGVIEMQHHRIHIQNEQFLDEYRFQGNAS